MGIATDSAGNSLNETTLGTITLDNLAPLADVSLTNKVISATTGATVNGTVSTVPYHGSGRMAQFHFEETSLANGAADSSGNFYTATCNGSACPTAAQTGKVGSALSFNGTSHYLTVGNFINPANSNFSAALWFKADTSGSLIEQTDGRAWLYLDSSNRLSSDLGGSALLGSTVSLGAWHHAAVTYDGTTLKLYVDGTFAISQTKTMEASSGAMLFGANKTLTTFTKGLLDEVTFYNAALTDEDIYRIANPVSTNVSDLKVRYCHASGSVWPGVSPDNLALYMPLDTTDLADMSVYNQSASCSTNCPTFKQAGQHGYAAQFNGNSDLTIASFIDPATTQFSAAAWVKPNTALRAWK